ncbi:hypothetical protein AB836_01690 [Rickettsiales bacterium (ex Bugula neritina AB1)]|nr:hypothetical protein AB836_01690 [Rickettsiales bacterium (ex Bugula neritina AB1)]
MFEKRILLDPLKYPWAWSFHEVQSSVFWLPEEVSLDLDLVDYKQLTEYEKGVVNRILGAFTKMDEEVGAVYVNLYLPHFQAIEIRMMLLSFANMETIHVKAYRSLPIALGIYDNHSFEKEFMEYKEIQDKYEYMQNFKDASYEDIAINLAVVSGFIEGVVLFGSFAILLYFSKRRPELGLRSLLKGVGQIVAFSIRDESIHCQGVITLYKQYLKELKELKISIDLEYIHKRILEEGELIIENEMKFIDFCFQNGDLQGLTKEEIKEYIRYIFNRRLIDLGLEPKFSIKDNPLPWVDAAIGVEIRNFFTGVATNYQKVTESSVSSWDDVSYDI